MVPATGQRSACKRRTKRCSAPSPCTRAGTCKHCMSDTTQTDGTGGRIARKQDWIPRPPTSCDDGLQDGSDQLRSAPPSHASSLDLAQTHFDEPHVPRKLSIGLACGVGGLSICEFSRFCFCKAHLRAAWDLRTSPSDKEKSVKAWL